MNRFNGPQLGITATILFTVLINIITLNPAQAQERYLAQADNTVSEEQDKDDITQEAISPGKFEVDEDAAERALERTLIQTGVLLLRFGQVEIEPSISYTRIEQSTPVFFNQGGNTFAASNNVRRNVLDTDLQLRFGLPLDSQIEFRVPYRYVDEEQVITVGASVQTATDDSGDSFGDLEVGLAKTFLKEGNWWPDIVGRVNWDSDTGKTRDNDVFIGSASGFQEISGTLSMVKRQDPLAFVGAISYESTLEKDGVQPGDQLSFTVGTVLAASPDTSLRFSLTQSFIDEVKIDNVTIDGSNAVSAAFNIGASSLIGRGYLLDISTDLGLTDDTPKYSIRMSLGKRFNIF